MALDYEILLSLMADKIGPDILEKFSRESLRRTPFEPFVRGVEFLEQGIPAPDLLAPTPGREEAQQKIEAVAAQKQAKEQAAQAEAAETQRMQEAAYQNQLDPMTWVGGDKEKLERIRAQAREMGGGTGAGGEGGFVEGQMTPEYAAIQKMNEAWMAGAPERELSYAMTPEQRRRDPAYAASAADQLAQLRASKAQQQRADAEAAMVQNQMKLIEAVQSSESGKVPFKTAGMLSAAGLNVPWELRGKDPDAVKSALQQARMDAQKDLQDPMTMGAPPYVTDYLRYVDSVLKELEAALAAGADPDMIAQRAEQIISGGAQESGTLAYLQQPQGQ